LDFVGITVVVVFELTIAAGRNSVLQGAMVATFVEVSGQEVTGQTVKCSMLFNDGIPG
jgi:hypothetical protein